MLTRPLMESPLSNEEMLEVRGVREGTHWLLAKAFLIYSVAALLASQCFRNSIL